MNRRALGEKIDHLRARVHIGRRENRIDHAVRQRHEIGQRIFAAVWFSQRSLMLVIGYPELPARPSARAADGLRFFEQPHSRPAFMGGNRRRQSSRARSQYYNVKLEHRYPPPLTLPG